MCVVVRLSMVIVPSFISDTTPGRMLKMQSNILVEQCLMIAQFVLILIGALKKAGNGAVEGVVDKYYPDFILHDYKYL